MRPVEYDPLVHSLRASSGDGSLNPGNWAGRAASKAAGVRRVESVCRGGWMNVP